MSDTRSEHDDCALESPDAQMHDHNNDDSVEVTVMGPAPDSDAPGAGNVAGYGGDAGSSDSDNDGDDDNNNDNDATAPAGPPDPDALKSIAAKLEAERAKSAMYEQKLRMALADYENLSRRTASEVESKVMAGTASMMSGVLGVRDDFARARDTYAQDGADTAGLDSVLRNIDTLLEKHGVGPIDALGEIFDPGMHEAVSSEVDPMLDEGTITKELRRGYMLKSTIIRPSMVVISKKE